MDTDHQVARWRLLQQVADKATTGSIKKTINAAILLRAAQPASYSTKPRKANRWLADCFLGSVALIVSQHDESLLTLIHHIQL